MKTKLLLLVMILLPLVASAHDIEVKNADGVTIYYNFINGPYGEELYVTFRGDNYSDYNEYTGNVVIPKSVIYDKKVYNVTGISERAFSGCSGLTSVTIPNSVTSIGEGAFSGCYGLTSVAIPNSVMSIGAGAFYVCSGLTSITIPNSVTSIGDYAFSNCSDLTSVTLNSNAIVSTGYTSTSSLGYIFGGQVKEYIIGDDVTSIGDYAFRGCYGLTSVTIPNSVTSIGDYAFSGCFKLTSVTIPNSVTSIGERVFSNCSGLTSVTIPNSVKSIGNYAFYNCPGLTSVTIPNSVTSIGDYVFSGCIGLTSVTALNPTPVAITEYVFTNRRNVTLYVPKGSKSAYQDATTWKQFKEIVEIDVTGIKAVENEQIAGSDETGNWYTLDGRRLSGKPTKRGIYIVNGRKVIVN